VTIDIAGDPIVVTRNRDGALHALANVCRHRNTTIVEGTGTVSSLQCPYHRWTYRLDGQLLAAPDMDHVDGFTVASTCLPQLGVETWNAFVFVNLDPRAPALGPQLMGLDAICAPYDLASMRRVGTLHYHQAWSWKVALENFAESYHHAGVHASTLQAIYPGERSWAEPNDGAPWMSLDHVTLDESITDEDVEINRHTAHGLRSRFAHAGRASRLEEGCRQFRVWWLARMGEAGT
jgi:phenylpropionate dioxygenase-like ring-hydroxylating dioxygenase large terminal subunit